MAHNMDDMAPQSISFIGDQDSVDLSLGMAHTQNMYHAENSHPDHSQAKLEASLGRLNISSGSRTYRIPSPTRPLITSKSFQDPNGQEEESNGKGFYISFDNDAPKRPKPPLRTKRSPKEPNDPTSGQSSASTLDSGRSMDPANDRFRTTTRKSSAGEVFQREHSPDFGSPPPPPTRQHRYPMNQHNTSGECTEMR